MELSLTKCASVQEWDDFAKTSPQRNVFCSSSFLNAMTDEHEGYFVEANGEKLLGAITFGDKPSPRPFTTYQGVLFAESVSGAKPHTSTSKQMKLIDFLLEELEKELPLISFSLHHSFPDIRSFLWFHYHEREKGMFNINSRYTGLIDLEGMGNMEEMLMDIRTVRRQEVRKAEKNGWIVEESTDISLLDDLHKKTFDRQDIERPEEHGALVKSIAESAFKNNYGEMLIAKKDGVVASAVLTLFDDRCTYYLFGANDPEYRSDACGSILLANSIQKAKERGLKCFDTIGINSPARGDYKVSFNAVPTVYFDVTWTR
ncbi:MAG: GNAT family N-acetyltransferase [Candidatus Peribacteraceae bacterium]|jgi:hypothetical protein|nr:GNAT family N-acetyltransferase [Candidatus Peribacteraceae bacterium]MDP7454641.1 GNAT family N-acetyltransferase [Candidatus Peribacteraceae bacterium]